MTPGEFVTALQDYYEQRYNSRIKVQIVMRYVADLGIDLDTLFEVLVFQFKGQYGKLPDVAAIREIIEDSPEIKRLTRIYRDEEDNVWSRGRRIGHYDSGRFIPDYSVTGVPENVRQLRDMRPEQFLEYVDEKSTETLPVVRKAAEGGA